MGVTRRDQDNQDMSGGDRETKQNISGSVPAWATIHQ